MKMSFKLWGVLALIAATCSGPAVHATEVAPCIKQLQVQYLDSPSDASTPDGFSMVGYWQARLVGKIEVVALFASTSGSETCISDIKFLPSTDNDNPPPAPAGYVLLAKWRVDNGGGWPTWKDTQELRAGMAGLYFKRLRRGHSGSAVAELKTVASNSSKFAPPTPDYRQIGSWDTGNNLGSKGSDGSLGEWMYTLQAKRACYLQPGSAWARCQLMDKYPGVAIVSSPRVTSAAVPAVEHVYETMLSNLKTEKRPSTMNGFSAYITNGETSAELDRLWVVNAMHAGRRPPFPDDPERFERDKLRGAGGPDYLWVSEGMICKTGNVGYNETVAGWNRTTLARNQRQLEAAGQPALETNPRDAQAIKSYNQRIESLRTTIPELRRLYPIDTATRTFDQVVHEFAHSLDFRFGRRPELQTTFQPAWKNAWPEASAIAAQRVFSVPAGSIDADQRRFMDSLFKSEAYQVTFDCQSLYTNR